MTNWERYPMCPKCAGYGWLWWHELDEYHGPANQTGTDDTKYQCDHTCHRTTPAEQDKSR